MEGEESRKKISFGFSVADDNIKLIDMLSEDDDDDDFLVASPFCSHPDSFSDNARNHGGFRLSRFENSQEKNNLQPSDIVQTFRQSFLRRSLAWDSAFFSSAGVLDPDELSFINKGLETTQDVHKRRSESISTTNEDGFCLHNWFEIEPFECRSSSMYKSKSTKEADKNTSAGLGQEQEKGLQDIQALKKINKSSLNKVKSNQTPNDKRIKLQSEKNKTNFRREQASISSPNPPRALNGTNNISTRSNNKVLSRNIDAKMENISATNLQSPKQNSSQANAGTCSAGSLSAKNLKPSRLRPPSPRIRFFDENTPPRIKELTRSRKVSQKATSQETSATAETRLHQMNSEMVPDSSISSRTASACEKLKSPCPESAYNVKKPKTDHTINPLFPLMDKRSRKKPGMTDNYTILEGKNDDLKKKKKKKTSRGTHIGAVNRLKKASDQQNVYEDQSGDLCKYFEAIDLNQEKAREVRKKHSHSCPEPRMASTRTPLSDKTSSCNL